MQADIMSKRGINYIYYSAFPRNDHQSVDAALNLISKYIAVNKA